MGSSSSLRAAAQKEAAYFGAPHATITRIEPVRIGRARRANRLFRIFPDATNVAARCAIPHGGAYEGTLTGRCFTRTRGRRVEFTERWSAGGKARGPWEKAGWIVSSRPNGRVKIEVNGQPSQFWF